jgi:hypothetical protein
MGDIRRTITLSKHWWLFLNNKVWMASPDRMPRLGATEFYSVFVVFHRYYDILSGSAGWLPVLIMGDAA